MGIKYDLIRQSQKVTLDDFAVLVERATPGHMVTNRD
jgi:hypothetical protein